MGFRTVPVSHIDLVENSGDLGSCFGTSVILDFVH